MDIATQAEIVLRDAGYDTWLWTGVSPAVTCFENAALVGFVHVFASVETLAKQWNSRQEVALARHATALRLAGAKAWNVYSVFLTDERPSGSHRGIERIEEDFSLTRKIARCGIRTTEDVQRALLPLVTIKANPVLRDADFESRLRSRLKDIPTDALTAFLGDVDAEEVAQILEDMS